MYKSQYMLRNYNKSSSTGTATVIVMQVPLGYINTFLKPQPCSDAELPVVLILLNGAPINIVKKTI